MNINDIKNDIEEIKGLLRESITAQKETTQFLVRRDEALAERIETQIVARLDRIIENTGAHWRDHEDRLRKLEQHLGLPPA